MGDVNANMADYLVPVNADVPDVNAIYLSGDDRTADPIGVKGLGEVVIVGVARPSRREEPASPPRSRRPPHRG